MTDARRRPWMPRPLDWGDVALAAYLVAAAGFAVFVVSLALWAPAVTDYVAFDAAGTILNRGSQCLYCLDVQRMIESQRLGGAVPASAFPVPFDNLPLAALAMRPLAWLPVEDGLAVFLGAGLLAMVAGCRMLAATQLGPVGPRLRVAIVATGVFSFPALMGLRVAQWDPLLLIPAIAAITALREGRDGRAGLLLGILLLKPQLVWLAPVVLLACGRWRTLGGMLAAAGVWVGSAVAILGPEQAWRWASVAFSQHASDPANNVGMPSLLAALGGGRGAAAAAALAALATGALGYAWRRRLRADAPMALALGLALSVAFSPHTFPHNDVVLAVPLALWATREPRSAIAAALVLSATWALDAVPGISITTPGLAGHVEALGLLVVVAGLLRAVRRGPSGGNVAPRPPLWAPSPAPARP